MNFAPETLVESLLVESGGHFREVIWTRRDDHNPPQSTTIHHNPPIGGTPSVPHLCVLCIPSPWPSVIQNSCSKVNLLKVNGPELQDQKSAPISSDPQMLRHLFSTAPWASGMMVLREKWSHAKLLKLIHGAGGTWSQLWHEVQLCPAAVGQNYGHQKMIMALFWPNHPSLTLKIENFDPCHWAYSLGTVAPESFRIPKVLGLCLFPRWSRWCLNRRRTGQISDMWSHPHWDWRLQFPRTKAHIGPATTQFRCIWVCSHTNCRANLSSQHNMLYTPQYQWHPSQPHNVLDGCHYWISPDRGELCLEDPLEPFCWWANHNEDTWTRPSPLGSP